MSHRNCAGIKQPAKSNLQIKRKEENKGRKRKYVIGRARPGRGRTQSRSTITRVSTFPKCRVKGIPKTHQGHSPRHSTPKGIAQGIHKGIPQVHRHTEPLCRSNWGANTPLTHGGVVLRRKKNKSSCTGEGRRKEEESG